MVHNIDFSSSARHKAANLGHGEGYEYSHNSEDGIATQEYLGVDRIYYQPVDRGFESELRQRNENIKKRLNGS